VTIDLPPLPDAATAPVDLGEIVVPDARTMRVEVRHPDGTPNTDWKGEIRLEGVPDVAGPWSYNAATVAFMLPTPPPPGATILVFRPGETAPAAVARAPFDFAVDRAVALLVPDPPAEKPASPSMSDGGEAK
jgi:hypothetical protein